MACRAWDTPAGEELRRVYPRLLIAEELDSEECALIRELLHHVPLTDVHETAEASIRVAALMLDTAVQGRAITSKEVVNLLGESSTWV